MRPLEEILEKPLKKSFWVKRLYKKYLLKKLGIIRKNYLEVN